MSDSRFESLPSGRNPASPWVRTSLATLLMVGFADASLGQENDDAKTLGTVVVTASGFEQELRDAPASISVVTREELESKPFRDLAEALADVEGIDVRGSTGKTGGLSISMRGLPSAYTLILIDGRRQNVAGDVTPNGFGDALTSFIPPVSAIERIEVIRGPMSTLYGSDAMGGVINIITRRVAKTWGGTVTGEVGIAEDSKAGNSRKFGFYLTGPLMEDRLGLAVRGAAFNRSDSNLESSSAGGEISTRGPSPTATRQHELGARLTLTPDRRNDIWLDVARGRSWYNNDECQLGTVDRLNCVTMQPNTTISGYKDFLRFNRDEAAIGHTGRYEFGRVDTSLTRTTTENIGRTIPGAARERGDPSIGTDRELKTTNTVLDTKVVAPIGETHLLTAGAQYWDANMTDSLVQHRYEQRMWAVFAEDEWRFQPDLAATVGLRYNRHDAFGGNVSPRAYLVWNATDQFTVKGGVSRGFRAPRLNQLVDGVSGISGQGTQISIGNPNLKPETSTSTEFGVLWANATGSSASATLFYNRISDLIGTGGDCTVNWISSCSANPIAEYSINNEAGKSWGLEFGSRVALGAGWSLGVNYTWTDTELIRDGRKAGDLSDTARHIGNAILRYEPTESWGAWLRAEYRGKSRRFDGSPADLTGASLAEYRAVGDLKGYALMHIGGDYKVTRGMTLRASIWNLLDKDFRKFTPYDAGDGQVAWASPYMRSAAATKGGLPTGRTLWLAMSYDF